MGVNRPTTFAHHKRHHPTAGKDRSRSPPAAAATRSAAQSGIFRRAAGDAAAAASVSEGAVESIGEIRQLGELELFAVEEERGRALHTHLLPFGEVFLDPLPGGG